MKINIIFASKDIARASLLIELMERQGYSIVKAKKGREVNGMLAQRTFDLLILGQKLEDQDGLAFLKEIRDKDKNLPIVAVLESPDTFLEKLPSGMNFDAVLPHRSGGKTHKMTYKLAFFHLGADECLSYNQDLQETLARIKAVIRRTISTQPDEIIKMNEIELNMTSYTVKISGKEINVTAKEFDLLYVFLSSPNRVLSRPYLIERVWGYNYFGSPRTVDVHVRRLRAKLGKAAKYVHTVPCVGYKLVPNTK